ncbi:hypothetical protein M8C21_004754, partial [Ambrosia artemisiifolia]
MEKIMELRQQDMEFDINITLKELMKDNELFRNRKIQETCDNMVQETIVDEVIDNDVLEENGYDIKATFKVFDEMPNTFENEIQESIDGDGLEIQEEIVNNLEPKFKNRGSLMKVILMKDLAVNLVK